METWVLLSVLAAAFQTLRFMLQKQLSMGTLSPGGATLARFFYAAPIVVAGSAVYVWLTGAAPAGFSAPFWGFALIGGLAQILATWCVVALFSRRNFAVGITFKKTEVVQTALVGLIILGDRVSLGGLIAILIGLIGVLVLSQTVGTRRLSGFFNMAAGLGLAAGALFAVSAVTYRAATLEIASEDPLLRACVTLAVVTSAQTIGLTSWLAWREPGQVARVWAARRSGVWMGITGMGGSLCWFTAFTLQNAAYVFAVGQIEVIFSILASVLFFRETISRREYLGIALLTLSILSLVLLV